MDTTVKITALRDGREMKFQLKRALFVEQKPLVEVDFVASRNATRDSDLLLLKNVSGRDLTNCIVAVTLASRDGPDLKDDESNDHVHFLGTWRDGERRVARYMSSRAMESSATNRLTLCGK